MVAINHQSFSREIIEACHEKNIKVAVWFSQKHPEKTEYYQNMLELGVDTIITDRPVELKEYIAGVIASSEQLHNL